MKSSRNGYQYDISEFNTYSDFEKFFNSYPELKEYSLKHFRLKFPTLYKKYELLIELGKINRETQPFPAQGIDTRNYTYGNTIYNTLLDFDTFIINNNIKDKTDFLNRFPGLFNRARRLGFINKIHFPGKLNYNDFNSISVIQDFIDEYSITSKSELRKNYISIYRRYNNLKKSEKKDLIFKDTVFESSHEKRLFDWIITNSNIQLIPQIYINKFRYDFLVNGTNLLIEVHGPQHFDSKIAYEAYGLKNQLDTDKKKYQNALDMGYNIIYFSYVKEKIIKNSNYFKEVIINEEELINIINKESYIPRQEKEEDKKKESLKSNFYDYSKDPVPEIKTTPKELLNLENFNLFLEENKISSPKELRTKYKYYYGVAERNLWIPYLIYYTAPNTVGSSKNYKTLEDIQNLILKLNLHSQEELFKVSSTLVALARRKDWLKHLKYVKKDS